MANQHTQALEQRAAELAAEFYDLEKQRTQLHLIVSYPVCGKPGHGFKAAKKARKQLNTYQDRIRGMTNAIEQFVSANKAGPDTRHRRREAFTRAYKALLVQNRDVI